MAGKRPRHLAAAALTLALLAGCGGSDEPAGSEAGLPAAGGGGAVTYALPELPRTLDPLAARSRPAQIVSRQIHEPLVATMTAPYGGAIEGQGLALSLKPSPDRTVWKVTLRTGVVFQDGTPLNAAAVLANARRWSSTSAGRRLLPNLFAVDAPRPNEVRFQFERATPDLGALLGSPRLGVVSPEALQPAGGERSRVRDTAVGTGTGPFEANSASAADQRELSRYALWWGTALGLGPALEAIAFVAAPEEAERLELLSAREAQIAEPLEGSRAELESDPLLRFSPAAAIGFEASVRGLETGAGRGLGSAVPVLSGVWLTTIAG